MKLDLTPLLPVLPYLGWLLALLLAWLWLRPALTPSWIVQLLESERSPSIRLASAAGVVVFVMSMDAAGRLSDPARSEWLTFAGVLLGLGTVKVVASRFAPKPTTDPTEQADPSPTPSHREEGQALG